MAAQSSRVCRLVEIIKNLRDRIDEAKLNGWLGEVTGLQVSLDAATRKLLSLDRMRHRLPTGAIDLGVAPPIIRDPGPPGRPPGWRHRSGIDKRGLPSRP